MEQRMRTRNLSDLGFAHRFIPSGDRALTLLLIGSADHGTPNLLEGGRALASDAAVLSLSGLVPPEQRCQLCHPDTCDVERQAHRLVDFVILAAQVYGFNPGCVVAAGDASGATLGASVLLLRQELLAGAILLHPRLPLVPVGVPFLSGVPIFIGAGLQDVQTLAQDIAQLTAIFEAAGADVTLFWRRGAATLQVHEVTFAAEWFQRHVRSADLP
jgi:phospholipase/carboxylesterase